MFIFTTIEAGLEPAKLICTDLGTTRKIANILAEQRRHNPPGASETLSGILSLRLPRTLHAAIAQADAEKASASTGSSSPPQKVPGIGEQADSLRDF